MRELSYKKEIEKYLSDPPRSWRKMFLEQKIPETPSISQVLSLLDRTAGENLSNERKTSDENPKNFIPPNSVREEAMKGIRLSYEHNYPSYNGIGLARAIQLAIEPSIWKNSVDRMKAFFGRNSRYETLAGFNNDQNPSKSYLAYLNWGGISGKKWVEKL